MVNRAGARSGAADVVADGRTLAGAVADQLLRGGQCAGHAGHAHHNRRGGQRSDRAGAHRYADADGSLEEQPVALVERCFCVSNAATKRTLWNPSIQNLTVRHRARVVIKSVFLLYYNTFEGIIFLRRVRLRKFEVSSLKVR